MKRAVNLLFFLFFIYGVQAQSADFRGFNWGSSFRNVKLSEAAPLILTTGNDELVYKDILGGSDCNVYYIFNDNDKLESGMYIFTKKYSNPQLYMEDYNNFKNLLTEKYGKPTSEKEYWSSRSLEIEKHNFGQAVADGNLSLNTVWYTDRSTIKIELISSLEHTPSLQIHYTANSLDELENKALLKEAIKKL
jgi:hypothetical protein